MTGSFSCLVVEIELINHGQECNWIHVMEVPAWDQLIECKYSSFHISAEEERLRQIMRDIMAENARSNASSTSESE
jgi:hypothetical protein